ncbi:MAG: glycosyltransferase, partial [Treponemataceae bacterium]|nr:glycosyltransferase [Treponemataceae bacterium]
MKNKSVVAFTGGGTGGHIYPGLAVADLLRKKFAGREERLRIVWLGSRGKMDRKIVQNARSSFGENESNFANENSGNIIDAFYGIPSGKLRR